MPQLDKHDPHIADVFRRATLEREQQDQRLADLFGTHTVPKVTEETSLNLSHFVARKI
jgi:hypothetical protein